MALHAKWVRVTAFDVEKALYRSEHTLTQCVFVAGLARAGTTALLNALHQTDLYASLTYADMPFVLAPNCWQTFSGKTRHRNMGMRAHGDGIAIATNSPEAFEEVFWQTFGHEEDAEHLFRTYIALIAKRYRKTRYLSKNNQNIRRLPLLAQWLPDAVLLIPYRDPLQHAYSLLRQHQHFCRLQTQQPFVREYMRLIRHSEFGLDYQPISQSGRHSDPHQLNHWLEQWLLTYQRVLTLKQSYPQIHMVCYEWLCADKVTWRSLCRQLKIKPPSNHPFRLNLKSPTQPYDKALLAKCQQLYQQCGQAAGL